MTKSKSFSKRYSRQQRLNAASIVQRLPFHQQLTASQTLILKVTPYWYDWCETQRNKSGARHFSAASDTTLSTFDNGVLSLTCNNKTSATLLRHQHDSLLSTLHAAGFTQIDQIQVRMAPACGTQVLSDDEPTTSLNSERNSERLSSATRARPQLSSIKSIEAVLQKTSNEQLTKSLMRLIDTLKKQ